MKFLGSFKENLPAQGLTLVRTKTPSTWKMQETKKREKELNGVNSSTERLEIKKINKKLEEKKTN